MPRGLVVATHGRRFLVDDGVGTVECVIRGKKGGVACGDQVRFRLSHAGGGVIEAVEPRRNLLFRSDEMREKLIAANLDQAVVVVAAVPPFREELLIRCLAACTAAGIPALILLNKSDLAETGDLAKTLETYRELGYPLLTVSAHGEVDALRERLHDRVSVLVGGSGVGKSTLLNRLVPDAGAATGEISEALAAGRHTTTHARMYALPGGGRLIDSPGMQEFGLRHLDAAALMTAFPEIRARRGQCRYHNCRHLREPGCAVRAAVEAGGMTATRYKVYQSLLNQLGAQR